ncbi:MAG: 4-hydroxyphenylpyruvate dioxygenase [Actinocatenispora sp.]
MDVSNVDHVEFYVGDAQQMAFFLCTAFGFRLQGQGGPENGLTDQRSLLVRQGGVRLLLTSGLSSEHPASRYVQKHGDGVARIGLGTTDAKAAFEEAVAKGATAIEEPHEWRHGDAVAVTATVSGFGDVAHRFIERHDATEFLPGAIDEIADDPESGESLLEVVDHLAVCVPAGHLEPTVKAYQDVFGFADIFTEKIEVGTQAMDSIVVQSPSGQVTLTIIAPDPTAQPGQIDDFLRAHDGAGVQHIAFSSNDISTAIRTFGQRGVRFLSTPGSYYDAIEKRLGETELSVTKLREGNILVDRDHWGEMFQIFTESTFVRGTLFFELIERHGALTFGSNNIKALYEAKERERAGSSVLA